MKPTQITVAAILSLSSLAASAITFTPGHFYSTSDYEINEYSRTGSLISSFSDPRGDLRGLEFGADGLLYVVHAGDSFSGSASVEALDSTGSMVRSYAFTGSLGGSISLGKISFDASGQNFYVGAENGIYKFDIGAHSGSLFKNVLAFDLKALPAGGLLVASGNEVSRYDGAGALTGSFSTLADPNGLTGDPTPMLVDAHGIEYDQATDTTFLSMLGYSGAVNMSFKLIALAGSSNSITKIENYWYGDDMLVTPDGQLLVGSRTQPPGLFSTNLLYQGQFSGPDARFVTALPVPEPSAAATMLLGLGMLTFLRKRRQA